MLFVTYWEVNENMPVEERAQIAQKLTSSGLFPPRGSTLSDGTAPPICGALSSRRRKPPRTWSKP